MATLITGGTGFLGSYVARHLLAHDEGPIVLFDTTINTENIADLQGKVTVVEGDQAQAVELFDVVKRCNVQRIVHLGYAIFALNGAPDRGMEVNINGTNNVFQIARIMGIRVVWASSGAAYGYHPVIPASAEPLDETAACRPISLYGKCKLFNEMVAEDYANRLGLDHIGLRLTSIYGVGRSGRLQTAGDFYCLLVERAFQGRDYEAPPADQMFNWTYVEDVARVFRVALNAPKPRVRIFNVSGDARTAGESADHVRNTLVPGAKITFGTHPVRRIPILSNALIRAELGWAPTYTMEQGMQEYLARLRATTG
ncbi:MAG: NAD(P)-dependent oxidoreductase [Alphaproteobacteria bacterium]